jgi:hypothetical protein
LDLKGCGFTYRSAHPACASATPPYPQNALISKHGIAEFIRCVRFWWMVCRGAYTMLGPKRMPSIALNWVRSWYVPKLLFLGLSPGESPYGDSFDFRTGQNLSRYFRLPMPKTGAYMLFQAHNNDCLHLFLCGQILVCSLMKLRPRQKQLIRILTPCMYP